MKKVVLFDVDGTILDTGEFVYSCFEQAFGSLGLQVSRQEIKQIMGKTLEEACRTITQEIDPSALAERYKELQFSRLHLVRPYAGAEDVINQLQQKNIAVAAVTNRVRWPGVTVFSNQPIGNLFDFVITADMLSNPKPHPEGILRALEHFNLSPQDGLMIGDSPADIAAGKQAQVKTAGITHGPFGAEIADYKPDIVIHSLSQVLDLL